MAIGDIELLDTLNQNATNDFYPFSVKVNDSMILSAFNVVVAPGENKIVLATMRVGSDGALTATGNTAELDDIADSYNRDAHIIKVEDSDNLFVCVWAGVGYDGQCAIVHVNGSSGFIDVVESATAFDPSADQNLTCRIGYTKDNIYIIATQIPPLGGGSIKLTAITINPVTGAITLTGETSTIADGETPISLYWIEDTILVVLHNDKIARGWLRTFTVSGAGVITATGYSLQIDTGDAAGNCTPDNMLKCGDYFAVIYYKASTPKALLCKTFTVDPNTGIIVYSGQSLVLAVPTTGLFNGPNSCYCRYDLNVERHIIAVPYLGGTHGQLLTAFVDSNGIIEAGGDAVEIYDDTTNHPRAILM